MKKVFITGISGQDGSYLAESLLEKGYEVHGLVRRNSNHVEYPNLKNIKNDIHLHYGDLIDSTNLRNVISKTQCSEIYNLAAQSHVHVSFELPEYTAEVDGLGPLRILDTLRSLKMDDVRYYQASTSEMFGDVTECPQNENTQFRPASPYGCAKLFAHWIVENYRKGYNMYACSGILYNHESPRRGELFVTRKITKGFSEIKKGNQEFIELGNLDSLRDWGHAKDYVEAMWLMLQQNKPEDFVIATGIQHSVRDFCNLTANYFGYNIEWFGTGLDEIGVDKKSGKILIKVNADFYRPVDVVNLHGDPTKAKTALNWKPKCTLQDLVEDMCKHDYEENC